MKKAKDRQILIAVDGNALLHRAWHALPPLTDRQGRLVNAVYGFLSTLFKTVNDFSPTHLVVAFDRPGENFRHAAYEAYKATRTRQPDELYAQIPILEDLLKTLGIPVFGAVGYEADDVLGTIARLAGKSAAVETLIVTGDLDTLQLVGPKTKIVTLRKGLSDIQVYDESAVRERFGIDPEQMIDFKALRGDPSDNIKGAPGVGEKTASELIKTFGSVEKIYSGLKHDRIKEIKPLLKEKLLKAEADVSLAKDLVTIRQDLDLDFSLRRAEILAQPREKLVQLFGELGFKSLLDRVPSVFLAAEALVADETASRADVKKSQAEPWIISEATEAAAWLKTQKGPIAFLVGPEPRVVIGNSGSPAFINGSFAVRALKPIFENEKIEKTTHDLKSADKILRRQGIALAGVVFDAALADYLLSPGMRSHDLPTLAFEYLKEEIIPRAKQGSLLGVSAEETAREAAAALAALTRLAPILKDELAKRNQANLLLEVELPFSHVLADMERLGVKIDARFLEKMSVEFGERIAELQKAIWLDAQGEFNIASPQQLKEVLFERLRIRSERIRKTASGAGLSTAASELEKLRGLHPIIEKIFEFRELTKLKSTYIDALPALLDPETGRLHTSYNQTVTATGRVSSSEPNLQNIPVRTELGREIRRAFVAEKGHVFVAADYSQIELRLVAAIAGAKKMIEAFKQGEDIHRRTAATVWGREPEAVTAEERRAAKAVNFGVIYGMGPHGLAEGTGLSLSEAKEFIRKYFEAYPEIRDYIELTKELARRQGYVETVFGRRRYLPEIDSSVPAVRAAAERMAINHPIQGTAADLLKMAMIRLHDQLKKKQPAAKLILTVHDEVLIECPEKEAQEVAKIMKQEMEGAHRFSVPIVVDLKTGKNWGEMKDLS
jgi:DNA polymerase-1